MSGGDLTAALLPVVEALQRLGVGYYVTGSVASSAHGVARASLDVDLVAELTVQEAEPLADLLDAAYYTPRGQMRAAAAERRSFNLIHLETMFKIDVFVSKDRPFDREVARRARAQMIDQSPAAPTVLVASAEDTVLAKLEWFRRGGETSERQWWDIVGVLRVNPAVDTEYMKRWSAELGVADLLVQALEQAAQ
jgi:hypothetical protein